MDANNSAAWSRRHFLRAGLAAGASVGLGAAPGPLGSAAVAALPTVKPIWSHAAYSAFGICALPHRTNTPYQYTDAWMAALDQTGAPYFRGMYKHDLAATATTTAAARSHGIKWGMTVCPKLSFPDSELVERIRHIAANAADRCLFIEGINEPNSDGSGQVPPDWERRTVAKQKLIWQTVNSDSRLAHVKVLGPKLQAVLGTESQYRSLGAAGIAQYMDFAALACYPGGRYPYEVLDQRLGWIRKYWDGKPPWITETGYTNALAATTGHAVVPEDVSAAYGPSLLLEALDRSCRVSVFELLDSPDPGAADDTEDHFGFFAIKSGMAPPWRAKPVVKTMASFLNGLKDPGRTYDPPRVPLSVTSSASDVRSTVTGKRDGSVTVHLRRARDCWDPEKKVRLSVPEVRVKIQTSRGTRTVKVDHNVLSVTL